MNWISRRRTFLLSGVAAAAALAGHTRWGRQLHPQLSADSIPALKLPERNLGGTGVTLPILGLGGAGQTPLSKPGAEGAAVELIQQAFALGIRYFDTAASYGPSETYLGRGLPPHRAHLFLASKTAQRDRDQAWRELERSLLRLNTDYLDLWQLHHVSFAEELDQLFGKSGAIQALQEAQSQKLVRLVGITGHHDPSIIVEGLRRYPFQTALIPINAADVHHPHPFIATVLPVARQQQVGVIAMKVPAYGRLLRPGVLDGMHQAMGYTLSQPGVHACIIAAEDAEQLAANIRTAQAFKPLTIEAMAQIEQKAAASWEECTFFRDWT